MGKQVKTIEYRFHAAIPHKARSMASRVHRGEGRRLCDWGGPFKSHPRNHLFWSDLPISATKKISHEKPEVFSGFLRFSPVFSFSQNSKNSQNKKISFAKND